MVRPPRFEAAGATHHVVAKGVAGTHVVRDDHDRRSLWIRLARTVARYDWRCLAYCFLDTHIHLVIRTTAPNLGDGMQWLSGRYAQEFNARWGRAGHLFGGRFYSGRISSDDHLVSSIVYVLLNPVRAGIVDRPELWPWSSYAATVGLADPPSFLDVASVLEQVDQRRALAQQRFALAVEEALASRPRVAP